MNLLKIVALNLLISSIVSAKIHVEPLSCNNVTLRAIPEIILVPTETKSQCIDDIRLEVTLTETNIIIFDLAKKDDNNHFVSFYRTALISPDKETELGFGSTNGFSLVLRIAETKE